jgi:hypothetical protein
MCFSKVIGYSGKYFEVIIFAAFSETIFVSYVNVGIVVPVEDADLRRESPDVDCHEGNFVAHAANVFDGVAEGAQAFAEDHALDLRLIARVHHRHDLLRDVSFGRLFAQHSYRKRQYDSDQHPVLSLLVCLVFRHV